MNPINPFLLATMLVLPVGALYPTGQAAGFGAASSVDARIRLDWEVGTRHGRPVIQGYVNNDYLRAASNVLLLVETLDTSGAVIAREVGFVRGIVPFNDRSYFEVPVRTPGAAYRVSVTAFDWKDVGGGGGGGGGGM